MKKVGIDHYRLIAAFLVVAIHISPFASINSEFDFIFTRILCRVAVPFFLMITGYFVLPRALSNKEELKRYIFKIAEIYLVSISVYLPLSIYANYFTDINFGGILKLILMDGTFYHLWYFPALIFGMLFIYLLFKVCDDEKVGTIVFFLFVIGLFGDSYYGISTKIPFLKSFYDYLFIFSSYTRNFLFYVPIFLYMGYSFRRKNWTSFKSKWLLFFFLICLLIEGYTLHILGMQRHDSMYFFLVPVMYFLFNLILESIDRPCKKIRNIATYIYIMHPFFIVVVRNIAKILKIEAFVIQNSLILYICVVLFSFLFGLLFEKFKEVGMKSGTRNC